jgi:transposase
MGELGVAPHAGLPVLLPPLRGTRSAGKAFGQVGSEPSAPLQTTYRPLSLGADRALYSADNRHKLADPSLQWIPRGPATVPEAQEGLAQAPPESLPPLQTGYRARSVLSTSGGGAQRWGLLSSEQRQPQAQRPVDKRGRKQRQHEGNAGKTLGRTAFAWEADAHQALARLVPDWPTTFLHDSPVCPTPRSGKRGRPGPGTPPAQIVSHSAGALAARLAARRARIDQQRGLLLATNALDEGQVSSQAVLDGYTGPAQVERRVRFLTAPQVLASPLSRKKPERLMALFMVMPVCWLVYAALAYRIRPALKEHGATFPAPKGRRLTPPTTRWVLHSCVGIPVLYIPGQGRMLLHLPDEHQPLLQLLGKRSAWFYR